MASKASTTRWSSALATASIGFAVVIAVSLVNSYNRKILELSELKASDLRLYYSAPPPPTGHVVIAAIDDKSVAELGRWPWPRNVEARLVFALAQYKVAVLGFDVIFSERDSADVYSEAIAARLRKQGVSEAVIGATLSDGNDRFFAQAIKAQGSTYLAYVFNRHFFTERGEVDLSAYRTAFLNPAPVAYNIVRKRAGANPTILQANAYLAPIPELNAAARSVAYVDIDADEDGSMRSYPLVVRFNGRYCVPMFLTLVDAFAHHQSLSLDLSSYGVAGVAMGNYNVPVDEAGRMMIHFRGPAGTIPHYSVADIIARRIPPKALEGKIVLIGVTGHGLGDRFVTPVGGDFPGVEIQADAIDTVLRGDFIRRSEASLAEERYAAWIMGALISVAAAFLTAVSSFAAVFILGLGYSTLITYQLSADGTLVGIVFPLVTLLLTYMVVVSWRYITEGLEKRHLRRAFEYYLNPDVIASVVDNPDGLKLGGERRHLSILFADIVNFTARAERTQAEPLVALLNTYMTAMINIILESGGVVDKLMGDGIMAFWGAPLPAENPARNALNCALKMFDELHALAQHDERFKDVDIAIGIATGEAVVGNFGGEQRFDYSVIGDTVNLASRLEGLTRRFKVHILVNRQTLVEAGGESYIAREIGLVKVKGKEELVPVVDVAAHQGDSADLVFYRRFSEALGLLSRGFSPEADLHALLRERPGDQVIAMCLERLHTADTHPQREMVFEFETK
jgi:adenylate cyclase